MALDPQLKQKIDGLVAQDPVVLFMKGTRSFPQCGFSASVVNILNTLLPKYATVNILAEVDVRTGMKDYSDWPTFPQLYIKGEFVGGADIVKQMYDNGDLEKKLGELVAPAKLPALTVTPAAAAELVAALKEGGADDVIHLTITPQWEHQLDLGGKESSHVTIVSNGVTVQLDRASAARAEGVSIDFVVPPGQPHSEGGFKIDNPNRPPAVREIGAKDLKQLLDTKQVTHFYDVRTPKERDQATLGATLLDDAAMAAIDGLPRDTPIAFHCHRGGRSRSAAEHFLKQGFKTVYNLAGGIDAWSREVDAKIPRY
jgi:monothiol glutaredoxin